MITTTISYDIALRKTGLEVNKIRLDDLKDVITDVTENLQPITTQFPDLLMFVVQDKQIQVTVQDELVAIKNTSTDFNENDITLLAKLSQELNKNIPESLEAYGVNLNFVFAYKDTKPVKKIVGYINENALIKDGLFTSRIATASFLVSEEVEDGKRQLQFIPGFDKKWQITPQVKVNANAHFDKDTLPTISNLTKLVAQLHQDYVQRFSKLEEA